MRFFKELFKSPYLISLDILPKDFFLYNIPIIVEVFRIWNVLMKQKGCGCCFPVSLSSR